jgi:sulfur-oxidizing protein SoxA
MGRGFLLVVICVFGPVQFAFADPEGDLKAFREHYQNRFSSVPLESHKDGVYAIDEQAREQWLDLEEFPPYEIAIDEGAELFELPFGKSGTYKTCFGTAGIKHNYPYFDNAADTVVTLEMAINACRERHHAQRLPLDGQELAVLVAYIAFETRGQKVAVKTPNTAGELAAYNSGKQFYQSRRGQLNFSCGNCHVQIVGNRLRAEVLSASLGHVTHWPVYRLKWQEVGTLHRRFRECNSQVGAEPFDFQSEPYRNLEYFLSYMSNGLEWNGPASRK